MNQQHTTRKHCGFEVIHISPFVISIILCALISFQHTVYVQICVPFLVNFVSKCPLSERFSCPFKGTRWDPSTGQSTSKSASAAVGRCRRPYGNVTFTDRRRRDSVACRRFGFHLVKNTRLYSGPIHICRDFIDYFAPPGPNRPRIGECNSPLMLDLPTTAMEISGNRRGAPFCVRSRIFSVGYVQV